MVPSCVINHRLFNNRKHMSPTSITLSVHYFFFLRVIFSHFRSSDLVNARNEW